MAEVNERTVRMQNWYNEFSTGNIKMVKQCLKWGADIILLVGIKVHTHPRLAALVLPVPTGNEIACAAQQGM